MPSLVTPPKLPSRSLANSHLSGYLRKAQSLLLQIANFLPDLILEISGLINRVPKIRMLQGEKLREFVLTHERERLYLENAAQLLRDVAMLVLDIGLRIGEVVSLTKSDVRLNPANGAKFGLLRVREGKSKNAKRFVLLTERVQAKLKEKMAPDSSPWIFPDRSGEKPFI